MSETEVVRTRETSQPKGDNESTWADIARDAILGGVIGFGTAAGRITDDPQKAAFDALEAGAGLVAGGLAGPAGRGLVKAGRVVAETAVKKAETDAGKSIKAAGDFAQSTVESGAGMVGGPAARAGVHIGIEAAKAAARDAAKKLDIKSMATGAALGAGAGVGAEIIKGALFGPQVDGMIFKSLPAVSEAAIGPFVPGNARRAFKHGFSRAVEELKTLPADVVRHFQNDPALAIGETLVDPSLMILDARLGFIKRMLQSKEDR